MAEIHEDLWDDEFEIDALVRRVDQGALEAIEGGVDLRAGLTQITGEPVQEKTSPSTTTPAFRDPVPSGHGAHGTVKWFSAEKGYGFIVVDGGADVFVHADNILDLDGGPLQEGQRVRFVLSRGQHGPQAHHVARVAS